ncbi:MAG: trimeric intracellular cation channel family protein [Alphaproteobacteria bacterium]
MIGALAAFELVGIAVFALTGALVAARKGMDPFGFALLGTVTGIGGGTLRDIFIGATPLSWIIDPTALIICVFVSTAAFFSAHRFESEGRARLLLWADGVGLALFAVTGTAKALDASVPVISAIVLGVMSATFGGIIRDVIAGEVPFVLKRDIYVTAALFGATVFAVALLVVHPFGAMALGFMAGFGVRAGAILKGWSLPTHGGGGADRRG